MIQTLRRYVRAFMLALWFTVRGEKPPLLEVRDRYPALAAWWEQTVQLVDAVERSAAMQRLDPAALKIHADGRDVSMATILNTLRYRAQHEYPYLLAHDDPLNAITLQAINLNDRHLVTQLAQRLDAPLKAAVEALDEHLGNLPALHDQIS